MLGAWLRVALSLLQFFGPSLLFLTQRTSAASGFAMQVGYCCRRKPEESNARTVRYTSDSPEVAEADLIRRMSCFFYMCRLACSL